ncbi:universal stress protein, partial [Ornithinimicrobium sp. W1665]|uniref:universal stress protein n=1 Tax=Ornithinimicrobium sp. W1665 TaxID=3416666 RepID=UPI003CF753C0
IGGRVVSATVRALGPVLVGVDGSASAASAVAWATAEASASGVGPTPTTHRGEGPAAPALREAARAGVLVVGRRGAGGFDGLSLGSTARRLVHEDGPVTVVVPAEGGRPAADAPVVVDVSPDAGWAGTGSGPLPQHRAVGPEEVLTLAASRAARERRPLLAVLHWAVPSSAAAEGRSIAQVWDEHARLAARRLERLLEPWRAAYPSVELRTLVTDRHPVSTLLDLGRRAELLVLPRGPRACAVVEDATCAVAVV